MKQLLAALCVGLAVPMMAMEPGNTHNATNVTWSGRMDPNVPQAVTTAFQKRYPDASVHKWYTEKDAFEVAFRLNHAHYEATFRQDGSWQKTERKYALTSELPAPVKEGFRHSEYAGCNIDGIKEVTSPTLHEFIIMVDDGDYYDSDHHDNFTEDYMLRFSPAGSLVEAKEVEE